MKKDDKKILGIVVFLAVITVGFVQWEAVNSGYYDAEAVAERSKAAEARAEARALQGIAEAEAKAKAEADLKSIKFVKKTKVEPEKPKGRDMEGCKGDLYWKFEAPGFTSRWHVMLKEGGGGELNGPWNAKVQQVSDQKFGGWWKFCDVNGFHYAIK